MQIEGAYREFLNFRVQSKIELENQLAKKNSLGEICRASNMCQYQRRRVVDLTAGDEYIPQLRANATRGS